MKKVILIVATVLGFAVVASAQPRAIGARIGWGAEISYQHTLGANNFLEADLGWGINDFRLGLGYDFSVAPVGPLDFYVGPAAQVAFINNVEHNNLMLGVGAQLGLEYFFDAIPLQLSLDWRPPFTLIPATGFGWNSFGLGIRYAF